MSRRTRLRRVWLRVHRWLGLTVGAVVVLLGLTGSLLVFDHAIDERLNPALLLSDNDGSHVSLDRAQAAILEAIPSDHRLSWLSAPRTGDGVYRGYVGPPGDGFWRLVSVDPVTAEVLGERHLGDNLMSTVYELHQRLLLGARGETVVGLTGVIVLLSLGSGLYLWWPRLRHPSPSLTLKRNASVPRRQFDLHRTHAIYSLPFLATIVFSGIFMALTPWLEPVVDRVSPLTDPGADVQAVRGDANAHIGPSAALATARTVLLEARWTGIGFPVGEHGAYQVAFAEDAHPRGSSGRSYVWVDPWRNEVLAVRRWDELSAGDAFLDWQIPLHNGEAFGLAGRWIVFVAGFVPLVLFITGFRIWRLKQRAARRNPHR